MVVDLDDFCEDNHRLDLLQQLHDANPEFRVTLFAIPALGSDEFWESVPEWCELAMHGWAHPHPRECETWSYETATEMLARRPERFVEGFKAPGWRMSPGLYRALLERDWWVADHWDNNALRPEGIRAHVISPETARRENPEHWHGHVQNVCGNGLEETFDELLDRVRAADRFEWMSELMREVGCYLEFWDEARA